MRKQNMTFKDIYFKTATSYMMDLRNWHFDLIPLWTYSHIGYIWSEFSLSVLD